MPVRVQTGKRDSKEWLDAFFERHADKITVVRDFAWDGGKWKYILARCAFDEGHANNATAAVLIRSNGAYAYNCQHQSCSGKHWKQFRALFEEAAQPPPTSTPPPRSSSSAPGPSQPTEWSAPDLLQADLAPLREIVPGLIYEGLGLIAGRPKFGKSFIIFDASVAIAGGSEALQAIECEEGDVLYYALEDGARRLQTRLRSTLGDRPPPPRLTIRTVLDRLNEGGVEEIEVWLEQHPAARLVAIDTWKRVEPARDPRADGYGADYQAAIQLKALADRYHVAIVLIHHTRKPFTGGSVYDFLDEVMGTTGVTAAADAIVVIQRQRGHNDAILHVTGRDVPEASRDMTWNVEDLRWTLGEDAEDARVSRSRQVVLGEINARTEWRTPTEIKTDLDQPMNLDAVKKMLRRLLRESLIESDGKGRYAKKGTPKPEAAPRAGAGDASDVPVSPKPENKPENGEPDLGTGAEDGDIHVGDMSPSNVPVSPNGSARGHGDIGGGHFGDTFRPPIPPVSISNQGVGGHGDTKSFARARAREVSAPTGLGATVLETRVGPSRLAAFVHLARRLGVTLEVRDGKLEATGTGPSWLRPEIDDHAAVIAEYLLTEDESAAS